MATGRAAFVFRDVRWNVANELPASFSQADARSARQTKVSPVVGSEIHVAEVAKHKRQIAEDSILGVSVLTGPSVLNLGRVVPAIHAGRNVPNYEWLVAEWTVTGLHVVAWEGT
jgi:hypothetical protein